MRLSILLLLQVMLFLPFTSFAANSDNSASIQESKATEASKSGVLNAYGKLPLYFIKNNGQVDGRVSYYERGARHATFFTDKAVVLTLVKSEGLKENKNREYTAESMRISFLGASEKTRITAGEKNTGRVNFFTGNDRTKWQSNVATYSGLTYEDVYKNIDISFYGNNNDIEHDVIVRPGGDPSVVAFAYEGIKGLKINEAGDLEVSLNNGTLTQQRPVIYHEINGERVAIEGTYRLLEARDGSFAYGFNVASYDTARDLVIDPVIVYSTYVGGSDTDTAFGIAVDSAGNAYITGETLSLDFPITAIGRPMIIPIGPGLQAFVTKMDLSGSVLAYSTVFGGSGTDSASGVAVDSAGNAYVTGTTDSIDFPTSLTAAQGVSAGGTEAFVTKFDVTGTTPIYSTYLGGGANDVSNGITVDSTGAAYVTGNTASLDFPVVSAKQPVYGGGFSDAFVTKLNAAGSAFTYSTFLGGTLDESGEAVTVNAISEAFVTGFTTSPDFPIMNPLQGTFGGATDVFVSRLAASGSALMYSTFIGGAGSEHGKGIAIDSSDAAYITGDTNFSDFPVVNPIQGVFGGVADGFVSKINPIGSALVYSTYLGGTDSDFAQGIAVDVNGSAYITGYTLSADFPVYEPVQGALTTPGFLDAFVTKINPAGSAYTYSTYIGGSFSDDSLAIALDSSKAAYIAGQTASTDYPLVNPQQGLYGGLIDAFVSKISGPVVVLNITPDSNTVVKGATLGYLVTATNTTAATQCFNYWENVKLPNGSTYPPTGELFGPVFFCVSPFASQSVHLTHGVPTAAPVGAYVFNGFLGAFSFPVLPHVVDESHFNLDVTAFGPPPANPQRSWSLLENGFRR